MLDTRACCKCHGVDRFARNCPHHVAPRSGRPAFPAGGFGPQNHAQSNHISGTNHAYTSRGIWKSVVALLDTGSELSLVPASLVKIRYILPTEQLLKTANGTEIRVLAETVLQFRADGHGFDLPCLVASQVSELILGLGWLESQDVSWNLPDRWVQLGGHRFPLYNQAGNAMKCRKIAAARDVKIQALSEMDVEAYAILSHLRPTTAHFATTPWVLESGLIVAGTLLPERTLDLTIRILNPITIDIQLRRGIHCPLEEALVKETATPAVCSKITEKSGDEMQSEAEKMLAPLWCEVSEDVPDEVKDRLRTLLIETRAVFSLNDWDLGFTDALQHEIDTGDETPVRQPLTLPPVIDEQVKLMLQQGLIERSTSAWGRNVVNLLWSQRRTKFLASAWTIVT